MQLIPELGRRDEETQTGIEHTAVDPTHPGVEAIAWMNGLRRMHDFFQLIRVAPDDQPTGR